MGHVHVPLHPCVLTLWHTSLPLCRPHLPSLPSHLPPCSAGCPEVRLPPRCPVLIQRPPSPHPSHLPPPLPAGCPEARLPPRCPVLIQGPPSPHPSHLPPPPPAGCPEARLPPRCSVLFQVLDARVVNDAIAARDLATPPPGLEGQLGDNDARPGEASVECVWGGGGRNAR